MLSSKGRTAGPGFPKPSELMWDKIAFSGSNSGDLAEYIFGGANRKGTGRPRFLSGWATAWELGMRVRLVQGLPDKRTELVIQPRIILFFFPPNSLEENSFWAF